MQIKRHARRVLGSYVQFRRIIATRLLEILDEDQNRSALFASAQAVYFLKRLIQRLATRRLFRGVKDWSLWKREINTCFLMKLTAWACEPVGAGAYYEAYQANNRLTRRDLKTMRIQAAGFEHRPLVSVLVPVFNSEPQWLERLVKSIQAQTYDRWELILVDDASPRSETQSCLASLAEGDRRIRWDRLPRNQGISAATNRAAQLANGDFLALVDHDDELTPDALWRIVERLQTKRSADLLYSDEEYAPAGDANRYPFFKPDFSPELLTAYNYVCHFLVIRRRLFEELGGLRSETDGAQDYDLILRAIEMTDRFEHIPRILYRWHLVPNSVSRELDPQTNQCMQAGRIDSVMRRTVQGHLDRTGMAAKAEVVRQWVSPAFDPVDRGKVSIIICTKNNPLLLWRCVRSIEKRTTYPNYEIVIVDNGSDTWLARAAIARLERRHRVLRIPSGPEGFSFSKLNNQAARHVDGRYLLFLNDDTRTLRDDWLTTMVGYAARPGVGVVGARLLFPDRTLQHAGLIVGAMGWGPWHALRGCVADTDDGFGYMTFPHNCIAVTGACMLTSADLFSELGGFDERRFAVAFNDVDYCLRLHRAGYRAVVAPRAELIHYESKSRGMTLDPEEAARLANRYRRTDDPYWNPNCTRHSAHFALSTRRQPNRFSKTAPLALTIGRPSATTAASARELQRRGVVAFRRLASCERAVALPDEAFSEGDVIVVHGADGVETVQRCRRLGLPCIWHLPGRIVLRHNADKEEMRRFVRILDAAPGPYRVVFDDLYSMHWFCGGVARTNVSCIEEALEDVKTLSPLERDQQRRNAGFSRDSILALGLARFDESDEADFLLDVFGSALRQSRRQGIDLQCALLVAGEPDSRSLERLRRRVRKLGPRVQVRRLSGADCPLLPIADIFMSHDTTAPRSEWGLKALQSGLPVICPRDLESGDLVHPGANGFSLARFDKRGFVNALMQLAADPQQRQTYGRNSRFWLQSRPDARHAADRWEQLLLGAAELNELRADEQPKRRPAETAPASSVTSKAFASVDTKAKIA